MRTPLPIRILGNKPACPFTHVEGNPMMLQQRALLILAVFLTAVPAGAAVDIENAFPALSFVRPVDLQHAGDGSDRLFVVEQSGVIWVFDNDRDVTAKRVFLDIQGPVNGSNNEEGLLGLAFHPEYPDSGYFYVNYTAANPRRTVVARYGVSTNPDSADGNSAVEVLSFGQPFGNHNGGQLAFGPDGYLYIGVGDGGGSADPFANGQNRQTLLGSLLRIDVDTTSAGDNYGIPPDNPYAENLLGYREEIYAFGLRNPWRFSFDTVTGLLFLADVGQWTYEEVDVVVSGGNYGWNIMEGFHCFSPPTGCNTAGLELPILEYDHSIGRSITGGYVYRGSRLPAIYGLYVFADFVAGLIWVLEYDGVNPPGTELLVDSNLGFSSFGVDEQNELYICAFDGSIYRFALIATGAGDAGDRAPAVIRLRNFPNPFNPETTVEFTLDAHARIEVEVFDIEGRFVRRLAAADRSFGPGTHSVVWDGRDHSGAARPSGVYFYRLTANGTAQETGRMILLK